MEGTRAGERLRAPGTGTPPNQSSGTAPYFGGADLKACGRPFPTQSLGHAGQATATSSQLVSRSCSHLRAPAQTAGPPVPLARPRGPGVEPTRAARGRRRARGLRTGRRVEHVRGPSRPGPASATVALLRKGRAPARGRGRGGGGQAPRSQCARSRAPRGGGSPGTDRLREGGRLTRRRKTAPANMALWRAPAGARRRRPPTPRSRPPSRARPRAATRGRVKPPPRR